MRAAPTRLETDVLVVGGGVAGCLAALEAREAGARVLVVDKARFLERAGSVGGGVDQYLTPMNSGPEWDTPEYLLMHIPELTDGLVDIDVAERVVHEMPRILRKLEGIGIDFRDPDTGEYLRTRAFGLPGEYHLNFDGKRFKYKIGRHVMGSGVTFLPRTMVTDVLVDQSTGTVCAAVAFHIRDDEWYVIGARSVVVATGDVNRISRNASGMPFDSWHYPYNTGDGHAMGFRAGADLTNMEFVEATLTPKGFSTQGTNSYAGLGAHFVNRHGERFMFKYDPKGEKARRTALVDGVIQEVLLGNEPLSVDLRHLPDEVLDHFVRTLGVDRHTLPGYFAQRQVDIRTDPIPLSISELSIRRGGVYFRGSGLMVDTGGETNVGSFFAAGDCSIVSGGIAGAAAMGAVAGRAAARKAATIGDLPPPPEDAVSAAAERLHAPLGRGTGTRWREFEDRVRQTVTDYVGVRRTDRGLRKALAVFAELRALEDHLAAGERHELMRVHEAKNIRLAVELMAIAALERRESRSAAAHRRLDFPDTDDERWRKLLVLSRDDRGEAVLRHQAAQVEMTSGGRP
ncbi:MAG: FAD-dependent oxidoreductase [Streptosporangiales bacterium]|nr:FAD-dependent oxidoreductase [Streptosporangiales bacterium]